MNRVIALCVLILVWSTSAWADGNMKISKVEPPSPGDFAYGIDITKDVEPKDAAGLYEVILPLDVYRGVTRSDLGDLRVFNDAGEVVPHIIRQPEAEKVTDTTVSDLPFFPIRAESRRQLDGLSLNVRKNKEGAIIDLNTSDQSEEGKKTELVGYVVDTSALDRRIGSLDLEWEAGLENQVSTVIVMRSDDLKNWSMITTASVTRLNYEGHILEKSMVKFRPVRARYLKLTWPPMEKPLILTRVLLHEEQTRSSIPRNWISIQGAEIPERPGEYIFDLKGYLPVDRIRFQLPDDNLLITAELYSTNDPDEGRQRRLWQGQFYHLRQGGETFVNDDVKVAFRTRYVVLKVDQRDARLGSGMPVIQFGWEPLRLIFMTRGAGPYRLAYGSIEVKSSGFRMDSVLKRLADSNGDLKLPRATAGKEYTLGGEARLNLPRELPWKKWILWSVLVLGVAVTGWMSVGLYRQMQREGSKQE